MYIDGTERNGTICTQNPCKIKVICRSVNKITVNRKAWLYFHVYTSIHDTFVNGFGQHETRDIYVSNAKPSITNPFKNVVFFVRNGAFLVSY